MVQIPDPLGALKVKVSGRVLRERPRYVWMVGVKKALVGRSIRDRKTRVCAKDRRQ